MKLSGPRWSALMLASASVVDSLLVNAVALQEAINQLGGNIQVVETGDFGPARGSQL